MLADNAIDWTAEWRLQGIQQGELSVLTRQLTRRFGDFPLWAVQRLSSASLDELDHWADHGFITWHITHRKILWLIGQGR